MATIQPRDLDSIQAAIEVLVNNSPIDFGDSDDEWLVRNQLIYMAIGNWEADDTVWDELWTTYTHGATLSGTTTYTLTFTNYRKPGSKLRLILSGVTSYIPLISPEDAQNYFESGTKVAYITGNNVAGYTLNLNWTPTAGDGTYGATVKLDYYKYATKPTNTTDEVEMSDPNYIIYWVAAQKALLEGQNNKFGVFDANATRCFETMKIQNLIGPVNQSDTYDDLDVINHGAVIGD